MANIMEHVLINKLGDDLDSAITFVGGDTSNVSNIMQYPQIIRNQLGCGTQLGKELILEGDSCIIEADEQGRDYYNTEYAVGEKTGLNPGTLYLRICTAVKGIEPVYIDLTRVSGGGSSIDIDQIVNKVLAKIDLSDIVESNQLTNKITAIVDAELSEVYSKINEKAPKDEFDELVINVNELDSKINEKPSLGDVNDAIEEAMSKISGSDDGIDINELDW